MNGILRRKSGIYSARLVVPPPLRASVGKRELIASTGVRDQALGKAIAGSIIAGWRRHLLRLQGVAPVDVVQVSLGSPLLTSGGLLPLADASAATGLQPGELLQRARTGRFALFVQPGHVAGFITPLRELDQDPADGSYDVPLPSQMPASALQTSSPGTLCIRVADVEVVLGELEQGRTCKLMMLDVPEQPESCFLPSGGLEVTRDILAFETDALEALRLSLAAGITPAQLEDARARRPAVVTGKAGQRRVSEAINAYMKERAGQSKADQARRIRAACELFAELMDNPRLEDIDRELLRHYRDAILPTVPANENKIRLQHRTTKVSESIAAVAGTNWPAISQTERAKRMQWLCGMFRWLHEEKWIHDDPAVGLSSAIRPRKKGPAQAKRDLFTREELSQIFSAGWFKTGRGVLSRAGTYREFQPHYYWLLLLGLYTGARINELCQLSLRDVRQTAKGVWFADIREEDDDVEDKTTSVKNTNSWRKVPLHPHLIRLGLPEWHARLRIEGFERLFPELRHDKTKGYSKDAVKWCSRYFKKLGWPRDGKKVFHSFRHTLSSECINVLGLTSALTAQISGHARGESILGTIYRKDILVDELEPNVARLNFELPRIAAFDIDEGVKALRDAIRRKRRREPTSPSATAVTEESSNILLLPTLTEN